MKVLLLNGSPRKNGCTYTALNVVADALKAEGIDAEAVSYTHLTLPTNSRV